MMEAKKNKNGRLFHLDVLFFTGEKFRVENCCSKMLVSELKEKLELIMGIPAHLQRLFYLDAADLIDGQPLKYVDIVPGALLKATVWNQWLSLVEAAVEGDVFKTLRQGVTKDSKVQKKAIYIFSQNISTVNKIFVIIAVCELTVFFAHCFG